MISEAVIDTVRRRLAAGNQSMRKIAHATGVSRSTVANIARGAGRRRPARRARSEDTPGEPTGRLERCAVCGVMTPAPCHACRVRNWIRNVRATRPEQSPGGPVEVELTGELRERYEAIHARRVREAWDE
jgi:hypothetical protein